MDCTTDCQLTALWRSFLKEAQEFTLLDHDLSICVPTRESEPAWDMLFAHDSTWQTTPSHPTPRTGHRPYSALPPTTRTLGPSVPARSSSLSYALRPSRSLFGRFKPADVGSVEASTSVPIQKTRVEQKLSSISNRNRVGAIVDALPFSLMPPSWNMDERPDPSGKVTVTVTCPPQTHQPPSDSDTWDAVLDLDKDYSQSPSCPVIHEEDEC